MKTVLIRFSGESRPDDLIIVAARHRTRGGQSSAKCRIAAHDAPKAAIPEASDLGRALAAIADEINGGNEFMKGEYSAKAKDRLIMVQLTDAASDVDIFAEVEGSGTLAAEVEVL